MVSPNPKDRIVCELVPMVFDEPVIPAIEVELSARLGYSAAHLRRMFWAEMGEPVGSFARRMRLERAAGRLALQEANIAGIAHEALYCTGEAFAKAFQAHFGCSPSRFKKLNEGSSHLLPGYFLSQRRNSELPRKVGLVTGVDKVMTYLYDGPAFLARILPNGFIDWSLP